MKSEVVHVAVGVVFDQQGRVLIARRPEHLHQGGLWEFPGGKVQPGESVEKALYRELQEETGIEIGETNRLIQIPYDYGDKQVVLDVLTISQFAGVAHGMEEQPVKWVTLPELGEYEFPAANRGIISALTLPDYYMITDEYSDLEGYISVIEQAISKGVQLIQFRAKNLLQETYLEYANALIARFQNNDVRVMLNTAIDNFLQTDASGLHLTSKILMEQIKRPIGYDRLLSASVHNEQEMYKAMEVEADFVVVSPVKSTKTHPGAEPLGWEKFSLLVEIANCPVYALGGLTEGDTNMAVSKGAQGLAGIRLFMAL